MKTIIIGNGTDITVEIKTDIIATIEELQTPGFNTRFTNMEFTGYDDIAKAAIDLRKIEEGWQSIIAEVQLKGFYLSILDISSNEGPTTIVSIAVTGISTLPATVTLIPTATQQITPTVTPSNATNKNVTYLSSNPAKATVNSAGLITAVATGSATITAKTVDGGFTDTTVVTVS
jgi:uncharacterized protein YjdB